MINLLGGSTDGEEFEVGITIGRGLPLQFHKSTGLLVDCLHIFPTSANDQTTLVAGD